MKPKVFIKNYLCQLKTAIFYRNNIPNVLYQRYIKFVLLSIAIFIGGIIICFTGLFGNFLETFFCTTSIAICLFLTGVFYIMSIQKNGYQIIEGECIDEKKNTISNISKPKNYKVISYLIKCDDFFVELPVNRGNSPIPKGTHLKIYLPQNAPYLERNNIRIYSTIWGFELISN